MASEPNFWEKILINPNATIKNVIELLDKTSLKIILVADQTKHLIGTISDGDIRRGLLRGKTLQHSIEEIVNKNPIVVKGTENKTNILKLMLENGITQIPVLNEKNQVIGLHLFDKLNISETYKNEIVIMAGGKGTRLRPMTLNCPKPLLQVDGKPILLHIIEKAKSQGFSNFTIAINYLGHMIESYFGNGEKFGVRIKYIRETTPLGTAGALSYFESKSESPFLVINGDVMSNVSFSELLNFHKINKGIATICVRTFEWQNPFGVLKTSDLNIVGIVEKPVYQSYINAGIYAFNPQILNYLSNQTYETMTNLIDRIIKKGKSVIAFPMHEPWMDIGRPTDLQEINGTITKRGD